MILTALLIGAALIAGGSVIVRYWNEILSWLQRCIRKIQSVINGSLHGAKIFVRKVGERIEELSRHYAKEQDGRWHETIVTREVSASEVPPEIRAKAVRGRETEVTHELSLHLSA